MIERPVIFISINFSPVDQDTKNKLEFASRKEQLQRNRKKLPIKNYADGCYL